MKRTMLSLRKTSEISSFKNILAFFIAQLENKATLLCERQKSRFIEDSAGRCLSAGVWNQHPKRDSSERAGGGAALPFLGVQGMGGVKLLSRLQRSLFSEAG